MSRQRYWVVLIAATILPFAISLGLSIFASREVMEYWVGWALLIALGFIFGLIVIAGTTIRRLSAIGNPGWRTLLPVSLFCLLLPLTILLLVTSQSVLRQLPISSLLGTALMCLTIIPAASLPENCKTFPRLDVTCLAGLTIGMLSCVGLGAIWIIISMAL